MNDASSQKGTLFRFTVSRHRSFTNYTVSAQKGQNYVQCTLFAQVKVHSAYPRYTVSSICIVACNISSLTITQCTWSARWKFTETFTANGHLTLLVHCSSAVLIARALPGAIDAHYRLYLRSVLHFLRAVYTSKGIIVKLHMCTALCTSIIHC